MGDSGSTGVVNVAVVIPRYYPIFGGAETQCRLLNRHLLESGNVRIPLLLTHRLREDLPQREEIDGVSLHRVGHPGISRLSSYGLMLAFPCALWRHRSEYDLVHCHTTGPLGFAVAGFCHLLNKPALLKISSNGELVRGFRASQSGPVGHLKLAVRRFLARQTCRWAYIVALNQEGLREALEAGAKRVEVIPNGVDPSQYHPAKASDREKLRADYGFEPDDILLLYAGRFTESKGLDILIPAFRRVAEDHQFHRANLCLAGSGDLQIGSVHTLVQAQRNESERRLRVLEPIIPAAPYYQMVDALVFPSRREGLPNVVLEALATGLPCLLSDIAPHQELREMNPSADIRLFRSGDVDDLALCLRRLLTDLSSRSPKSVPSSGLSEGFDIRYVSARYIELYRRLTGGTA